MIKWRRIIEIVKKEFNQVLRDPRLRMALFMPPLVQTIIFGFAINLDVMNARIAWMDRDCTPMSQELKASFEGSPYFRITDLLEHEDDVKEILDEGKAQAVVRILPGFARKIMRGKTCGVQVLLDGTDSNTASIIASYAQRVISGFAQEMVLKKHIFNLSTHTAETRVWFNPDLRSRDYFVTGVIVNIIAIVTVMLTAMSIVREKELGTMEQLMVSPIRPLELILGKTLPFAIVGLVDVILVTGAALLIFHIPFRGSALLLLGSSVLFLLTTLGTGLFISTVSHTQQQALMSTFFFIMPAFLLSGFTFPIRNMPRAVQYITYLNPLRYFIEIIRGIFLKGTGVSILWPQILALLFLGIFVYGLSTLRFHKRLDD
ncbi:MAG: ABC transporter permease [bacterium]